MAIQFDPYAVLGISPDASIEEIKTAYRRIARRLHPDTNPNNPGAIVQFQDVTAAHELLSDFQRKRLYDEEILKKSETDDDFYFTLRVTPSKRAIIPLQEPQVIYLLAEIFSDPRANTQQQSQEARVNLTLVLDQSNSMNEGARLQKVQVAANQIIDSLSPNDILSVITFNDRATTIIEATPITDKPGLKARISMMKASGGTEIFQGLSAGIKQNRKYLGPKLVNHVILLTDGHTFGDQERCLELAEESAKEGISISAMGLGHDWNDEFLDNLASKTGGSSSYISTSTGVISFLNNIVRQLSNAFAERLYLSIAPDPDVQLELAFKLQPHPQPLDIEDGNIPLGSLQGNRPVSLLLQFQMPANMPIGFRSIARLVGNGDILSSKKQSYQTISDISLEITNDPPPEDPPPIILDALSKLTLYRLQERAQEALEDGNIDEATKRLENLATRLLDMGETELARQVQDEALRVISTKVLSEKGQKNIKYGTRLLLTSGLTPG